MELKNSILYFLSLIAIEKTLYANNLDEGQEEDALLEHLEPKVMQNKKNKSPTKLKMQQTITGSVAEIDDIRELATAIASLETEIDKLSSEIQITKQKVLEKANLNNHIEIEAHLNDPHRVAIKSFTVKIDGVEAYRIREDSGLWLPAKQFAIFSGPLKPGSHRFDIEGSISLKHSGNLALNSEAYRLFNKSVELMVPENDFKRKLKINIIAEDKQPPQVDLNVDILTVK